MHLKFLTSHIYSQLDDLRTVQVIPSQEMMGQICDLETVEPQEILIKVCVMFYNALLD